MPALQLRSAVPHLNPPCSPGLFSSAPKPALVPVIADIQLMLLARCWYPLKHGAVQGSIVLYIDAKQDYLRAPSSVTEGNPVSSCIGSGSCFCCSNRSVNPAR